MVTSSGRSSGSEPPFASNVTVCSLRFSNVAVRVSDGVERELLQKLKLLGGYFSDSGIQTEILQQQDIVRLCNLVNNPAYVHLEDSGINAAIPILESVGVA